MSYQEPDARGHFGQFGGRYDAGGGAGNTTNKNRRSFYPPQYVSGIKIDCTGISCVPVII